MRWTLDMDQKKLNFLLNLLSNYTLDINLQLIIKMLIDHPDFLNSIHLSETTETITDDNNLYVYYDPTGQMYRYRGHNHLTHDQIFHYLRLNLLKANEPTHIVIDSQLYKEYLNCIDEAIYEDELNCYLYELSRKGAVNDKINEINHHLDHQESFGFMRASDELIELLKEEQNEL